VWNTLLYAVCRSINAFSGVVPDGQGGQHIIIPENKKRLATASLFYNATAVANQRLFNIVLFLEFLDAAGRIDDILLPGVKRMAVGADLNVEILCGRFRLDLISAGAFNYSVFVFWMYIRFH
jgi:hypothetical protein